MSVSSLDNQPHERFIVASILLFLFVTISVYMSYFITRLTVPTVLPAKDSEVSHERTIESINNFGIGEPCLHELVQG